MSRRGWQEDRIRLAGILVLAGLAIELATLFWVHPLSFTLFAVPGLLLVCAGILLYLYAVLVGRQGEMQRETTDAEVH